MTNILFNKLDAVHISPELLKKAKDLALLIPEVFHPDMEVTVWMKSGIQEIVCFDWTDEVRSIRPNYLTMELYNTKCVLLGTKGMQGEVEHYPQDVLTFLKEYE